MGGVAEWLSGRSSTVPVRTIAPAGFSVVAAGRERLARPELLASPRMAALIGACQLSFGFVVVDCPPLDPVADAVAIQDLLDGFLLVVRARRSPREAIERAVSRLKENRIHGHRLQRPAGDPAPRLRLRQGPAAHQRYAGGAKR